MKEFNYFAPGSVEEALELMKEYEGKYTILNGGTDVMIRLLSLIHISEPTRP